MRGLTTITTPDSIMRHVTTLALVGLLLGTGSALGQSVDFAWNLPTANDNSRPYLAGHSGARGVSGPYDLDGDGKPEVLVADYSGGARAHVLELAGPNTWEWVYSTPILDETNSTNNGRIAVGGDLDGDGMGEIILFTGTSFSLSSPYGRGIYFFEATGDDEYGFVPSAIYDFPGDTPDRWRTEQASVLDLDGDGKNELVLANDGANGRYDNWFVISVVGDIGSGFETFIQEVALTTRGSYADFDPVNRGGGSAYGAAPGDFDGDGHMDVLLTSWNNYNFTMISTSGPDSYRIPGASDPNVYLQATSRDDVALYGCFTGDINGDGDDEAFCPHFQTGGVSVVNYEPGEDVLQVTTDQVKVDVIPGLAGLGMTIGDMNGDGQPELIAGGSSYTSTQFDRGLAPNWLRISRYLGGDVEASSSYSLLDTLRFENDKKDSFDLVVQDSAGVITEYRTNGQQGPEFVAKLAYLGDIDNDGSFEVAMSFQGVDDSTYVFSDVFNPADSTYTRTLVSASSNPNRVFMRVVESGAYGVAIEDTRFIMPEDYKLSANYPNPFNPSTSFSVTLPIDKSVNIRVYDVSGRLVKTIVEGQFMPAGTHEFSWDGTSDSGAMVASGTYLYALEYGNFRQSRTMVLLK